MEMTIAIQKADYNEIARDKIGTIALNLGFSIQDSGQHGLIRYFGVDQVSKISKLARVINKAKRDQDNLTQFS